MIGAMSQRPERLIDAVRLRLQTAVLNGELAPGQQLSVPELARQLDVSRGLVREAVLQLVADGLAVERPRRGVVVVTISADEVRQIHEVREALEGQAARLCARNPSQELIAALQEALSEQRSAINQGDAGGYAHTDAHFHSLLAMHCGNPMLAQLIERMHTQMQLALDRVVEAPQHRSQGHAELQAVLDAVRTGDPDAAQAAMGAHIARTRSTMTDSGPSGAGGGGSR
jgi:DNA-binding GntR family transcriptional regulator